MRIAVNGVELFFDVYGSGLAARSNDMLNWFFARERATYDVRARLAEIAAPTLVLTGRHDKIAPPFASEEILKGIPQAKQEIFEESGHRLMREENAKFLQTVGNFIGRLQLIA